MFAPLKDFSKAGRAAADFCSQTTTETLGTEGDAVPPDDLSMSQNSVQGVQNSNLHADTENQGGVQEPPTNDSFRPTGGPSSSDASRLPRSLFRTPEFSCRDKRKHHKDKELEHMDNMVEYMKTGAKTELETYGMFIRDPADIRMNFHTAPLYYRIETYFTSRLLSIYGILGTVMIAVAELPGFTFGGAAWMEALRYFESHQFACASFLGACTTVETKLAYIHHALGK